MSERTPFATALRDQLVAAAAREAAVRQSAARRRQRPGLVAPVVATAAVSVLAFVALLLPAPEQAAADIVVRVDAGEIEVTLVDLEQSPRRIEHALRAAGLDVSIRGVPVGPSRVGHFVGQESTGPLPPELRRLDVGPGGFLGFVLPEGWPGSLRLLVGTPASGDQPFDVFSDALARGEALACRGLAGRPAAEVGAAVAQERLEIRVDALVDGRSVALRASDLRVEPWRSWIVTEIDGVSLRTVVVRLGPPGTQVIRPADPACEP